MTTVKATQKPRHQSITAVLLLLALLSACNGGNNSAKTATPQPLPQPAPPAEATLSVNGPEPGSAIYLDGIYTGKLTPDDITLTAGEHNIGLGLNEAKNYLKKAIAIDDTSTSYSITLSNDDIQPAKTWRALFIGVNKVRASGQSCISEYSTEQLDLAYDFFQWSFQEKVSAYNYHSTVWQFDRQDISDDVVTLSSDNLITPEIIDGYLGTVNKGDYDLIVSFFRGGADNTDGCYIDDFKGIAWYDYTVLNADASYYTIRYYDDIEQRIIDAKQNDPGMFIHEWLHTTAERFFPDQGYSMPSHDGQVVHAASSYNYNFPWMSWYQDLISGQVKQGAHYVGIGPEAFLACSVRENAQAVCSAPAQQNAMQSDNNWTSSDRDNETQYPITSIQQLSSNPVAPFHERQLTQQRDDGDVQITETAPDSARCDNMESLSYQQAHAQFTVTNVSNRCDNQDIQYISSYQWSDINKQQGDGFVLARYSNTQADDLPQLQQATAFSARRNKLDLPSLQTAIANIGLHYEQQPNEPQLNALTMRERFAGLTLFKTRRQGNRLIRSYQSLTDMGWQYQTISRDDNGSEINLCLMPASVEWRSCAGQQPLFRLWQQ